MGKKMKKIKKRKAKEADGSRCVTSKTVSGEKFDALKRKYIALKRKFQELEQTLDRLVVLEGDIKRVHSKLDSMDTDGESVKKEVKSVLSRMSQMQRNVEKMTILATKVGQRYASNTKGRRKVGVIKPMGRPSPKAVAGQKPSKDLKQAARALDQARSARRRPQPAPQKPSPAKEGSDEISVRPIKKGQAPEKKDHRSHADKMDDPDVITDEDMDTMDYLVKEEGKEIPLSKKVVDKEKEGDDEK